MNIEKVAVIGAGVMGASIAAHISNAGIPVTSAGHRSRKCYKSQYYRGNRHSKTAQG